MTTTKNKMTRPLKRICPACKNYSADADECFIDNISSNAGILGKPLDHTRVKECGEFAPKEPALKKWIVDGLTGLIILGIFGVIAAAVIGILVLLGVIPAGR